MFLNDLLDDGWTVQPWQTDRLQIVYRDTLLTVVGPQQHGTKSLAENFGPISVRSDAVHPFFVSGPDALMPVVPKHLAFARTKNINWLFFTDAEYAMLKLAVS